jgi:hypothetical protein
MFYYFRLEDQVPENHLLQLVDKHIDFGFVRERLKDSCSELGHANHHLVDQYPTSGRLRGFKGKILRGTYRQHLLPPYRWTAMTPWLK